MAEAEELAILQEIEWKDEELSQMEAKQAETVVVEHFEDDEDDSDISFAQQLEGCFGLGPLNVCAAVVQNGVRVRATLSRWTILSTTLTVSRRRVCVSPNFLLAKARVCVLLEVRERRVRLEGRLCVRRGFPPRWRCGTFNTILLSW